MAAIAACLQGGDGFELFGGSLTCSLSRRITFDDDYDFRARASLAEIAAYPHGSDTDRTLGPSDLVVIDGGGSAWVREQRREGACASSPLFVFLPDVTGALEPSH